MTTPSRRAAVCCAACSAHDDGGYQPRAADPAGAVRAVRRGAGLCYDVFRAARRVLCPGRAGETACDALFCVLMLAAAFRFAIVNAAGQWRLFVLLGACAGGALWQGCLSAAALPLFLGAAAALRAAAHRAGRGIQWCFQWASAEKIREIRKKVCKTPFHFSRKRYKIKSKSVQRQER